MGAFDDATIGDLLRYNESQAGGATAPRHLMRAEAEEEGDEYSLGDDLAGFWDWFWMNDDDNGDGGQYGGGGASGDYQDPDEMSDEEVLDLIYGDEGLFGDDGPLAAGGDSNGDSDMAQDPPTTYPPATPGIPQPPSIPQMPEAPAMPQAPTSPQFAGGGGLPPQLVQWAQQLAQVLLSNEALIPVLKKFLAQGRGQPTVKNGYCAKLLADELPAQKRKAVQQFMCGAPSPMGLQKDGEDTFAAILLATSGYTIGEGGGCGCG